MKSIKIELKLFQYDELNKESKEKAFNNHLDFLLMYPSEYENEKGEMVYEDLNQLNEYELNEYVEESIKINEYWFFKDGNLADCVTYTGNHEKAGITELKFNGEMYLINTEEDE